MTFEQRLGLAFAASSVMALVFTAMIVVTYYFLKGVGFNVPTELLWFWIGSGYAFSVDVGLKEWRR